ncbi:hypothetical protein Lal_00044799 [Lupinus albus]|nr:hypothetical protein Lal_00044799 [Lupinus albus]
MRAGFQPLTGGLQILERKGEKFAGNASAEIMREKEKCFLYSTNNVINSEPWLINHADFNRIFIASNIVHNITMSAGVQPLNGGLQILGAIYAHPYFFSSKPIATFAFEQLGNPCTSVKKGFWSGLMSYLEA